MYRTIPKKIQSKYLLSVTETFIMLRLMVWAPQLKINFHGSGDGGKASQNDPLRLGPGSFGSKLVDLDGLKVSNFQPKI